MHLVNMCFELREKQRITCLTIPCECERLLRERQKLASKLCKGRSKTERNGDVLLESLFGMYLLKRPVAM